MRLLPKALEQLALEVPRGDNRRALRLQAPIPHPDLVHAIHQLRHQIKPEIRIPKRLDRLGRRADNVRILDRVLKAVLAEHEGPDSKGKARFFNPPFESKMPR